MNKEIIKKIRQARFEENVIKAALNYNYFDKRARTRNFKALKKIQLEILKLYLEEKNENKSGEKI